MKKIRKFIVLFLVLFSVCAMTAVAHPGRTDSKGGHYNRSTGEYHYHHGYSAHKHTNGVCPYKENTTVSKPTSTTTTRKTTVAEPTAFTVIKNLSKDELAHRGNVISIILIIFCVAFLLLKLLKLIKPINALIEKQSDTFSFICFSLTDITLSFLLLKTPLQDFSVGSFILSLSIGLTFVFMGAINIFCCGIVLLFALANFISSWNCYSIWVFVLSTVSFLICAIHFIMYIAAYIEDTKQQ